VLGLNIGKNADTPIERAVDDYLICLEKVYPYASYVTVNISSPNTKNLRQLQGASELDALLSTLKDAQQRLADRHKRYVPIALKIAPDVDGEQVKNIADALLRHRFDAVIATNTTITGTRSRAWPMRGSRWPVGRAGVRGLEPGDPGIEGRTWRYGAHHWRRRHPVRRGSARQVGRGREAGAAVQRPDLPGTGVDQGMRKRIAFAEVQLDLIFVVQIDCHFAAADQTTEQQLVSQCLPNHVLNQT
jgi:hypothetical protein